MIKRNNLERLRLMAFTQVMKNVQSFLAKETNLQDLGLAEAKTEFDTAFSALENSVNITKRNEQTESITELDAQRDTLLTSFISHCKLYQNHPEMAKKEAAKRAMIQIETYGKDPHRRAYRDETAIIRNLISDFEKSQADSDITLIGAKEWLTHLKPINEKFDQLHSNRTMEQSERQAGQTKEARAEMQKKFDHLCKAISAMAFVKGEENYKTLANAINEEVKNALALAKTKNPTDITNLEENK
ncbi:MAG: DUF6261 family protein [Capnocytophaga sp.]|nr:DUF6261 family protein [Capnocytophaga sp.]